MLELFPERKTKLIARNIGKQNVWGIMASRQQEIPPIKKVNTYSSFHFLDITDPKAKKKCFLFANYLAENLQSLFE